MAKTLSVQRAEGQRWGPGQETQLLWKAAGVVSLQEITLDGGTNARTGFQVFRHDSFPKPSAILNTFSSFPFLKNLGIQHAEFFSGKPGGNHLKPGRKN